MTQDECDKTFDADLCEQKLPIPINPVIHATLRAIYSGGLSSCWGQDSYGRPQYHYEARDGHVTLFCEPPYKGFLPWAKEAMKDVAVLQRLYLSPRWSFIYAGSLREAVRNLSVETADVFLILMTKIAQLPDPRRDIARLQLKEIAGYRSVRVRHGSAHRLYNDLKQEVFRLADLRLTMVWRDYRSGRTITFGKERPDRLLDIVDVESRHDGEARTAFGFRCGQALATFLNPDGVRWIGYYSKVLLQLSPYHEAFAKKLGTYWIMVGVTAGKKGVYPRATPKTILDFCGEKANWRNPGQTVDTFIEAHQRLKEIGVLEDTPILEPLSRKKGYFKKWLETPLTVKLSESIWKVIHLEEPEKLSFPKKARTSKDNFQYKFLPAAIPKSPQELRDNPAVIRQFRADYSLGQEELARAVGVTRQTLSNYERRLRPLPEDTAIKILKVWRQRAQI